MQLQYVSTTVAFLFLILRNVTALFGVENGICRDPSCLDMGLPAKTDEQLIHELLLDQYDPESRPTHSRSTQMNVQISVQLNSIIDMDERNQILTTSVVLIHRWIDEFLRWNTSLVPNVHKLTMAADNVWLPDTAAVKFSGFLRGGSISISSDGTAMWHVPMRLQTTCKVDIRLFPFDEQMCEIQFGSWTYTRDLLQYIGETNSSGNYSGKCSEARALQRALISSEYTDNSDWILRNASIHHEARSTDVMKAWAYGSGSGMSSPKNQQFLRLNPITGKEHLVPDQRDLVLRLHLKRRSFFFIWNIIVPCVMLSVLTIYTFNVPVNSTEKISLGLSVFLAFSMFMMLIAEKVPPTSHDIPLIGIYMTSVMVMTALSVVLGVIVVNLDSRGDKYLRAPRLVRQVLIENPTVRRLCKINDIYEAIHADRIAKQLKQNEEDGGNGEFLDLLDNYQSLIYQCNRLFERLQWGVRGRVGKDDAVPPSVAHESDAEQNYEEEEEEEEEEQSRPQSPESTQNTPKKIQPPLLYDNTSLRDENEAGDVWRRQSSHKAYIPRPVTTNTTTTIATGRQRSLLRREENRRYAISSLIEQHEIAVMEWRIIAHILDRALFALFILATVLTYAVLFSMKSFVQHKLIDQDAYKTSC